MSIRIGSDRPRRTGTWLVLLGLLFIGTALVCLLLERGAHAVDLRDDMAQRGTHFGPEETRWELRHEPLVCWEAIGVGHGLQRSSEHRRALRMLLDRGAKVDAADDDGHTALMWAAFTGNGEVVRLLLAHGASVNAGDRNGKTALAVALKGAASEYLYEREGFARVVRELRVAGAQR